MYLARRLSGLQYELKRLIFCSPKSLRIYAGFFVFSFFCYSVYKNILYIICNFIYNKYMLQFMEGVFLCLVSLITFTNWASSSLMP